MHLRQIQRLLLPFRLPALVAGLCLSDTLSLAQSDAHDPLLIIPPPVPRYRRVRPAFEVKADKTESKVPVPTYPPAPVPDVPVSVPKPQVATPVQLARRQARFEVIVQHEAATEKKQQAWRTAGRVAGVLAILGVGIFCVFDIVRQIRKAKLVAALAQDEEDEEWEP